MRIESAIGLVGERRGHSPAGVGKQAMPRIAGWLAIGALIFSGGGAHAAAPAAAEEAGDDPWSRSDVLLAADSAVIVFALP